MKAVVMAGGEGSRLRPLTSSMPKPLVPVAGRPIMEHILLHLRRHQLRDVVATVQYMGASIRNYFGQGEVTEWSGDVFPKLLKEGEHVFGWIADGYWEDVGSHSAYIKANFDCLEGKVKVQLPGDRVGETVWIHPDAEVFSGARIDGPALIGAGAKVRGGAWVNGPAVIGAYTTIDSGVKISNSIVWDHSYIGLNSRLRGAVVCRGVTVKNGCLIGRAHV